MSFVTLIALVLAGIGVPPAPALYPIPPRPLRLLVDEAQFVVTARVHEADALTARRAIEREEPFFRDGCSVVVLEVDGLVKGDPGQTFIEQVNFGHMCPAPAHYVPGKRVLAFLDRRANGEGFETHALSYGAKTLDDAGMAVYLQRIREQFAIEEMPDDAVRLAAEVEWLVKCAEHPVTRWEGAYELAGGATSYQDPAEMDAAEQPALPFNFAIHLSHAQRSRLRDALLRADTFAAGEQALEQVLRDDRDPRLLSWLVAELRQHQDEVVESGFAASELIERIARRDGRESVRALSSAYDAKWDSWDVGDGQDRLALVRQLLAAY